MNNLLLNQNVLLVYHAASTDFLKIIFISHVTIQPFFILKFAVEIAIVLMKVLRS